jgi:hypothetical protein|tara:strand:- start:1230 stop:1865 length:636 start_codon:yes stop_codon:yes gene_type:complete
MKVIPSKTQNIYRIGDIFYCPNANNIKRSIENIINKEEYKDTIVYDYLIRKKKEQDYDTLKDVVYEHIKNKNYVIPNDDELVIHMRLGDSVDASQTSLPPEWYMDNKIIYEGLRKIEVEKYNIKKVTIITVFYYPWPKTRKNMKYTKKISYEKYEVVKNFFEKMNIPVKTFSRTVDEDFCYLVSSKYFLPTVGGFSRLAYELCDGKKFKLI